jgi:hypothetical protein
MQLCTDSERNFHIFYQCEYFELYVSSINLEKLMNINL